MYPEAKIWELEPCPFRGQKRHFWLLNVVVQCCFNCDGKEKTEKKRWYSPTRL